MSVDAPLSPPAHAVPVAPKKVSTSWTGAVMALGALVAAVGAFLPFEKLVFFVDGDAKAAYQFTGLGSTSQTGAELPIEFTPGNAGKIIVSAAVVGLVMGLLVLRGKGRLWTRIVALLAALGGLSMAAGAVLAAKSDAKDLNDATTGVYVHGLVKMGAYVSLAGVIVMVLGVLAALIVRRRSA